MLAAVSRHFAETARWTGLGKPDPRVLEAMRCIQRDRFVPVDQRAAAWEDRPLEIGSGQTISQPFVVALLAQLCDCVQGTRVLEIGTGCGYQAAVLAALGAEVWSIELEPELAREAALRLAGLRDLEGAPLRIHQRTGDDALGWPEAAPFARIVATAAPVLPPPCWLEQLAAPGRLIAPLGPVGGAQMLTVIDKDEDGRLEQSRVLPVRFVPLRH